MKIGKLLLSFGIFGVVLLTTYYIHVLFINVNVVFYSALVDVVIAACLTAGLLYSMKVFGLFSLFEKGLMVFCMVLLGYTFAISVPTVIDRSLSFYLLEKIQQKGGTLPYSSFDDVFKNEYMKEHHLVDIRLTEQIESGTITLVDGMVSLTPRGEFIAAASRFFRMNLLPKHRLIMGTYSDVLTDPFRNSKE